MSMRSTIDRVANDGRVSMLVMRLNRAIGAILPRFLHRALVPPRSQYLIREDTNGWHLARETDGLAESIGFARTEMELRGRIGESKRMDPDPDPDVVWIVPAEQTLRTRCVLPSAAERRLRDSLAYEMDRYTPFTADEVRFDYRIADRDPDGERIAIDLCVVRREDVEALRSRAARAGIRPDRIDVSAEQSEGAHRQCVGVDLLHPASRRRHWRRLPWANAALALAAVALLASGMVQTLHRDARYIRRLQEQAIETSAEANEVQSMRERIQTMRAQRSSLAARFDRQHSVSGLLADLSRRIPDGTYLTEFRLSNGWLEVTGYSNEPASVISAIQESGRFRDSSFESRAGRDAESGDKEAEQFNVRARLEPRGSGGD